MDIFCNITSNGYNIEGYSFEKDFGTAIYKALLFFYQLNSGKHKLKK
jgi:hypothetical protein